MRYISNLVLISTLTLTLSTLVICEYDETSKIAESLFEGYAERDESLWLCDNHQEGLKYRIPLEVDCNPPPEEVPRFLLALTFWWDDITLQKIKVFECYVEQRTVRVHAKWFEKNFITYSEMTFGKLQYEDCQKMVLDHEDPDGGTLNLLHDDFWGTKNHNVPEPSGWTTIKESYVEQENINHYFVILQATVSNIDGSLKTSAGLLGNCLAKDGHCRTSRGVLIWMLNKESYSDCRIKEGTTTSCVAAEGRVTCPYVTMSLSKITKIHICVATMGTSEQGVYFSVFNDTTVFPGVDTTEIVRDRTNAMDDTTSLRRTKREARFITSTELNLNLQYLYEIYRTGQNTKFRKMEREPCITQRVQQRHQKFFTEKGDPNMLLSSSDPSLRGRLSGDVMAIWRCREITLYYFVPRKGCYAEFPVKYSLGNHLREGYVRPVSHEIIATPTLTNCPAPEFYWDMGKKGVILLDDKSPATFIPYFPHPYQKADEEDEEQIQVAFINPAVYGHEEQTQQSALLDFVQQSANLKALTVVVQRAVNGLFEQMGKCLERLRVFVKPDVIEEPETENRIVSGIYPNLLERIRIVDTNLTPTPSAPTFTEMSTSQRTVGNVYTGTLPRNLPGPSLPHRNDEDLYTNIRVESTL